MPSWCGRPYGAVEGHVEVYCLLLPLHLDVPLDAPVKNRKTIERCLSRTWYIEALGL